MTEETPQSEGEPSPAPDETPTAETKAFTYDDASPAPSTTGSARTAVPGTGPFARQPPGYGNSPLGDGQGQQPNGNGNAHTVGTGGFLGVGGQAAAKGGEVSEVAAGSPAANAG